MHSVSPPGLTAPLLTPLVQCEGLDGASGTDPVPASNSELSMGSASQADGNGDTPLGLSSSSGTPMERASTAGGVAHSGFDAAFAAMARRMDPVAAAMSAVATFEAAAAPGADAATLSDAGRAAAKALVSLASGNAKPSKAALDVLDKIWVLQKLKMQLSDEDFSKITGRLHVLQVFFATGAEPRRIYHHFNMDEVTFTGAALPARDIDAVACFRAELAYTRTGDNPVDPGNNWLSGGMLCRGSYLRGIYSLDQLREIRARPVSVDQLSASESRALTRLPKTDGVLKLREDWKPLYEAALAAAWREGRERELNAHLPRPSFPNEGGARADISRIIADFLD